MLVSVCSIAYNQQAYIQEMIESVLDQKISFDLEFIISVDKSEDKTLEICRSYEMKYPDIIKVLESKVRLGMIQNFHKSLSNCAGKYIAICEGDDYWIDKNKLQKQVKILEKNLKYSICFSSYAILNEYTKAKTIKKISQCEFSIEEIIASNSMATASSIFIADLLKPIPKWLIDMPFGDWTIYLYLLHTSKTKVFCISDVTSVYRIHEGGIHGSLHQSNTKLIKAYKLHIDFYKKIQKYLFKDEYVSLISKCINERKKIISELLDEKRTFADALRDIKNVIPGNAQLIFVDENQCDISEELTKRKFIPFTEKDGTYWGPPVDDASAITEIKLNRRKGVKFIAFVYNAFWWLDYYSGMFEYLNESGKCILQNNRVVIFQL